MLPETHASLCSCLILRLMSLFPSYYICFPLKCLRAHQGVPCANDAPSQSICQSVASPIQLMKREKNVITVLSPPHRTSRKYSTLEDLVHWRITAVGRSRCRCRCVSRVGSVGLKVFGHLGVELVGRLCLRAAYTSGSLATTFAASSRSISASGCLWCSSSGFWLGLGLGLDGILLGLTDVVVRV